MSDDDSDSGSRLQDENMSISDEEQDVELAVVPVGEHSMAQRQMTADSPTAPIYRSCVTLNINDTQNTPAKPTHASLDSSTMVSPAKGIEQMGVSSNEASPQFQQCNNVLEVMPCSSDHENLESNASNESGTSFKLPSPISKFVSLF